METKTKRRIFDEAFKREAVALLLQGAKPLQQLAADLSLTRFGGQVGAAARVI